MTLTLKQASNPLDGIKNMVTNTIDYVITSNFVQETINVPKRIAENAALYENSALEAHFDPLSSLFLGIYTGGIGGLYQGIHEMSKSTKVKWGLIGLVGTLALLAGCAVQPTAIPTPTPTVQSYSPWQLAPTPDSIHQTIRTGFDYNLSHVTCDPTVGDFTYLLKLSATGDQGIQSTTIPGLVKSAIEKAINSNPYYFASPLSHLDTNSLGNAASNLVSCAHQAKISIASLLIRIQNGLPSLKVDYLGQNGFLGSGSWGNTAGYGTETSCVPGPLVPP